MDLVYLENERLSVAIHPVGAELQRLRRNDLPFEYLWSGDPAFWGKFSPVLFPIVGTLVKNHYTYQGTGYVLPRHGFAREKTFELIHGSASEAVFQLQDDERTRLVFPFRFVLQLHYSLEGERLTVTYTVNNPDEKPLYFSIGAHPAFALPLEPSLAYSDYHLRFSERETAPRWALQDGLLLDRTEPFLENQQEIPLTPDLFSRDAIVLKNLHSSHVTLGTAKSSHGLRFGLEGWSHLGIWAAKDAPFVCIEPWQGHADPVDHNGDFTVKPGIVKLDAMDQWERSWWVEPF